MNTKDLNLLKIYRQDMMNEISINDIDELCERYYVEKDMDAKEELIRANLPLVVKVSRLYLRDKFNFLDLIQEGNIGLLKAIDMYEYDKGFKFQTYAYHYILSTVRKYVRENNTMIRLPQYRITQLINIKKEYRRLESETFDGEVDLEIVSKNLDLDIETVRYLLMVSQDLDSTNKIMYDSANDNNSIELVDTIIDDSICIETTAINNIVEDRLRDIMEEVLNEREAYVIKYRYGFTGGRIMTFDELGAELNVSRQRIQQIEKRALKRLKDCKGKELYNLI